MLVGKNNRQDSTGIMQLAQIGDTGGVGGPGSSGDFARLSPQVRNPLLNVINFYLPQDRKVLNQWLKYYDRLSPIVGNSLDLHSEVCVSPYTLDGIEDEEVLKIFRDMDDDLDSFNKDTEIIREFYLMGEVFPFAQWNTQKGVFDQMIMIDPDYVQVHPHPFVHVKDAAIFEIEPSDLLKEFVNSSDPIDEKLKQRMDPRVRAAVGSGNSFRVSSFNMTGLLKRSSPYDIRGTSIVLRALKYLMYEDKLMEAQYKIADGHVAPRWIFKLGDQANKILPGKKDLTAFRQMLMEGWYDYNFAIISSYALQVDAIGSAGKIMPIIPEMEWIEDRILTALFTSKAATHGEGPTYANAAVARLYSNARYQNRRSMLEKFKYKKLYEPVAKAHKFYEPLTAAEMNHKVRPSEQTRKLMIPKVNWLNKLDLTDVMEFRQYLSKMRGDLDVSMKTVCRIFGLDYVEEAKYLERERGTIFDPVYKDYRKKHAAKIFDKKEGGETPEGIPTHSNEEPPAVMGIGEEPGEEAAVEES